MKLFFILLTSSVIALEPWEALDQLIEGNQRYIEDVLEHPNHSSDRRQEMVEGQNPFAVIVGCSDSRVAPEIIFDQGLGDLFIVRVAGNVVGPVEIDSVDYAVKYLGSKVILVMGHESCGAVTAVLNGKTQDIQAVAQLIKPAIRKSKDVEEAIKANVQWTVSLLKKSPLLQSFLTEKKIDIVGAYYHLGSGNVELLN